MTSIDVLTGSLNMLTRLMTFILKKMHKEVAKLRACSQALAFCARKLLLDEHLLECNTSQMLVCMKACMAAVAPASNTAHINKHTLNSLLIAC